jgi:hypothetical protein
MIKTSFYCYYLIWFFNLFNNLEIVFCLIPITKSSFYVIIIEAEVGRLTVGYENDTLGIG